MWNGVVGDLPHPTPDGFFYRFPTVIAFELLTIFIETGLIWRFYYRRKKGANVWRLLLVVGIANIVTWFIGLVIYLIW